LPKKRRPKRGSLAFHPRVRASDHAGRIRSWPVTEEQGLLGFPGYKAGMTHVHMIEDRLTSPERGREVVRPSTVIDCPPIKAFGLRMYSANLYGRYARTEAWSSDLDKELTRRIKRLPKENDPDKALSEMEGSMKEADDFTVIIHTMPRMTGIKKIPDVQEIALGGGSVAEKFVFAKGILGKEVRISDVFQAGEVVDVTAVTKGKGFQGPVKRFGIRIRNRKTNDARRNPGTLGPWHPHQVMWTVPMAGQTGYQQRTEHNKRLLALGTSEDPIRPRGGFLRYGDISGDYAILRGSTPGPTKRLINLRKAMRPWRHLPDEPPALIVVSTASAQGK
jgi:large subunit ribosomal protein L3